MKAELEQKRAERGEEQSDDAMEIEEPAPVQVEQPENEQFEQEEVVRTVPLSQSARPVKVNTYAERVHDDVKTQKGVTLSKLARKYYNNTYCWVYIYIANKDRLADPNNITPGMELIIPELTEEEMKITKSGSLQLYSAARQNK